MLRAFIGYPIKWTGFAGMGFALFTAYLRLQQHQFRYIEAERDFYIFCGALAIISYIVFRIGKVIAQRPELPDEYKREMKEASEAFIAAETDEDRAQAYRDMAATQAEFKRDRAFPWGMALLVWFLLGIPFTSNLIPGVDGRPAGIGYYILEKLGVDPVGNFFIGFGVFIILMIITAILTAGIEDLDWQAMTPEEKRNYNERVAEENREWHIKEAERKTVRAGEVSSAQEARRLLAQAETHRLRVRTQ